MEIHANFSLKALNTFGIDVPAKQYVKVQTNAELQAVLQQFYADEILILGGGSNILLTQPINKTVVQLSTKGIELVKEDQDFVWVKAQAGENWHEFVSWCISQGFGGLENLSLIPGNVGTSPIQNIGAYGVELKDVFVSCEAIHRQSLTKKTFLKEDCDFGYRDSVFKNKYKGTYIITKVLFKLTKSKHKLKTEYGAIQNQLDEAGIKNPGIADVAEAVIAIRSSKLPNPKEIGNSGSFFKNPVIEKELFEDLRGKFKEMPFYPISSDSFKIPAGWLIEQLGFKGVRRGDAGVHHKQALVLVNYGEASGAEILALAKEIQQTVHQKFNIMLEMEVNIL
ncbi:UDP-N-acetylmuramate dehydrogenase [Mesonia sp. HuA40]|uniref:UDP-N-acetylmuramate dehydrogenase n=1 Tax=Mesonia sp. HuA40 TaxID=2602761 RepID=UPI0011C88432|nr:UDP-N-acetylmuramate dehydrogenase [Mesonia sp. HuA40]TXK73821.1 UDP-N-acetylmuramate dehydrogenase [Mesonia sp. HuA40]